MANITPLIQEYIVDFASNNNFFFAKGIQGDGYGVRYVRLSLSNNGQPYIINQDSVSALIMGTKPDNKEICNECEIVDSSTIQFELTQQMLAVEGKGDYSIAIMSTTSNQTLKSFPFYIYTNKATFSVENIVSTNEFGLLTERINEAGNATKECINATNKSNTATNACNSATSSCKTATTNCNNAITDYKEKTQACETATANCTSETAKCKTVTDSCTVAKNECEEVTAKWTGVLNGTGLVITEQLSTVAETKSYLGI